LIGPSGLGSLCSVGNHWLRPIEQQRQSAPKRGAAAAAAASEPVGPALGWLWPAAFRSAGMDAARLSSGQSCGCLKRKPTSCQLAPTGRLRVSFPPANLALLSQRLLDWLIILIYCLHSDF